jgi:hypothetical protein
VTLDRFSNNIKLFIYYLIHDKLTMTDVEKSIEDVLSNSKIHINRYLEQYISDVFSRLGGDKN